MGCSIVVADVTALGEQTRKSWVTEMEYAPFVSSMWMDFTVFMRLSPSMASLQMSTNDALMLSAVAMVDIKVLDVCQIGLFVFRDLFEKKSETILSS